MNTPQIQAPEKEVEELKQASTEAVLKIFKDGASRGFTPWQIADMIVDLVKQKNNVQ